MTAAEEFANQARSYGATTGAINTLRRNGIHSWDELIDYIANGGSPITFPGLGDRGLESIMWAICRHIKWNSR